MGQSVQTRVHLCVYQDWQHDAEILLEAAWFFARGQAAKLVAAQVHLEGDKLRIDQEGRSRKFAKKVQQKTFAASSANGRPIMYVTERAVFKLMEGRGLELVEIAPGVTQEPNSYLLVGIVTFC